MLNYAGFKIFFTIPFLMELRTLMDWVWTDTSMTLFDWLKMEDIFNNIYQLKVRFCDFVIFKLKRTSVHSVHVKWRATCQHREGRRKALLSNT